MLPGGVLTGGGNIQGLVELTGGQLENSGDDVLTMSSLTWAWDSTIQLTLGTTAVNVLGDFTGVVFEAGAGDLVFNLLPGSAEVGQTVPLLLWGEASGVSLADFRYTSSISGLAGNFVEIRETDEFRGLAFHITAIPEPRVWGLLLGFGLLVVVGVRRRGMSSSRNGRS